DPAAAYRDVALPERRDPERPRRARIALGADAEPAEIDQPKRERAHPVRRQRLSTQVLRHRLAQVGEALGEANELVEFLLLLARPEVGVVQVLAPAGLVDSGRLELRAPPRRDPDVLPRGRDHELLDPREPVAVGDLL